jgi:multiple sugar transport system substrate-binding protein
MDGRRPDALASVSLTRRQALQAAAGAAVLALTGCAPRAREATEQQEGEGLVLISTQFQPVQEAEKMRSAVLAGFGRQVEFLGEEQGPFEDRIRAEAQAGRGSVAVIGGQHGDLVGLAADDLLTDLSDLTQELSGRGFNPDYLELAKAGGQVPVYIPWAQASYLMVARREAVDLLPAGADVNALTYDQLSAWGQRIQQEEGSRRLGFPAGEMGLLNRFFQGYTYPSFTGALNTKFASREAETMWQWMRGAWALANPQSTGYAFMQEPLQAGEVWVAWDHQARLLEALRASADDFVAFPAPTGPKGLGFIPVLTGLAIPKTAPDVEGAKDLIRYLTDPQQTAKVARELGFFPPTATQQLPEDLAPGIRAQADAVAAQSTSPNKVTSLLPVGLRDKSNAYNDVFRTTFDGIVLKRGDIGQVLAGKARELQAVLDSVKAPCWRPDPESTGTCQVG